MDIVVSISAELNDDSKQFVVAIYAKSAPTVLVQKVVPTKGVTPPYYTNPFEVVFTGLSQQFYNIQLWESVDDTPTGTLRNSSDFQPSSTAISIRADLYLTADVTPGFASGGVSYVDASLLGWVWNLEQLGYGTLEVGIGKDITQDNIGGGWSLVNGTTIQPQQKFCIHFQPQIAQATPVAPTGISNAARISSTTTLDNTYKNIAILLEGDTPQFIVNLMSLSTLSDFDSVSFYSGAGAHINVSIRCVGSDKIQRNTQVTKIVLGKNEALTMFKYNGVFQVFNPLHGVDMVGQLIESMYGSDMNAIALNGATVSRVTYERLWDRVQQMPTGCLISQSSWGNTDAFGNFINKGFFGTGDGSTTFTLPLLTTAGFRRAVDGSTRIPGSFQDLLMLDHQHEGPIYSGGSSPFGQGTTSRTGLGTFLSILSGFAALVSKAVTNAGATITRVGAENRPANTGVFVMMRV